MRELAHLIRELPRQLFTKSTSAYGRDRGVGRGLGVGVALGVTVGLAEGVTVAVAVGVGVGVPPAGNWNLPMRVCELKLLVVV